MKNQLLDYLKAFVADFLFSVYWISCLYYLAYNWFDFELSYSIIALIAFILTVVSIIAKDSVGTKAFLSVKKNKKKWGKSIWSNLVIFTLILTFLVGWNIVEVNLYKFFTKFKNAGGITSGIFDPSIVGYKLDKNSFELLDDTDIDPVVKKKIDQISNKKYSTKKMFIADLKKVISEAEYQRNIDLILNAATKDTKMLSQALKALAETIYLALLATIFAIPFAFILSFFAARNLMPNTFLGNTVYLLIRTIATIFRSVEAIVWAIIFSVWVGIGPFAGMLALMIHSIAALTKLYSEQIENIDSGPVEAIKATGASTLQTWIYAVIPQIISPYLAFTIYRWDINVRMATIVGFVGGGGIGLLLLQQQQMLRWHNVGLIIWMIAAVVWIMDMISAKIRLKLTEI